MNSASANRMRRPASGFTLFETMVAMFVMLIGLMGVFSVFGSGVSARLMAQEMTISQELALMWADWIKFRLNSGTASTLAVGALSTGRRGDFYADTGDFHAAPGNIENLPTFQRTIYQGYTWEITAARAFSPEYTTTSAGGTVRRTWDLRTDGNAVLNGIGAAPPELTEVELMIARGARTYKFTFVFSGVAIRYENN